MVCIYCGQQTDVNNSRLQKRTNTVWRRRVCQHCKAVFSTIERPDYERALVFQKDTSHNIRFQRDQLFLSIYDACRHRPTAVSDATALVNTIMSKLFAGGSNKDGLIRRADLREIASHTLATFDRAAAVQYDAFHPARLEQK